MATEIVHVTENRFDDKMFWVMDGGLCWDRFHTAEEAEQCREDVVRGNRLAMVVALNLEALEGDLEIQGFDWDEIRKAIKDWEG